MTGRPVSAERASPTSPASSAAWRLFARYLVFGALAFVVDFGLLALGYQVVRLPLEVATACAFVASFFVTYSLQRVFAFRSSVAAGRSLVRYAALVAANTLATVVIVWAVDAAGPGWAAGKLVATVVTTAWNFFAYRYFVFRPGAVRHV